MPHAARIRLGYTESMEKLALLLFAGSMVSFGIAAYLMTRGAPSRSTW
jgi:hypothetical protein